MPSPSTNTVVMPGRPQAAAPKVSSAFNLTSLYKLRYAEPDRRNFAETMLYFEEPPKNIAEAAKEAKLFCGRNNWQFVWLEPAIHVVKAAEEE